MSFGFSWFSWVFDHPICSPPANLIIRRQAFGFVDLARENSEFQNFRIWHTPLSHLINHLVRAMKSVFENQKRAFSGVLRFGSTDWWVVENWEISCLQHWWVIQKQLSISLTAFSSWSTLTLTSWLKFSNDRVVTWSPSGHKPTTMAVGYLNQSFLLNPVSCSVTQLGPTAGLFDSGCIS